MGQMREVVVANGYDTHKITRQSSMAEDLAVGVVTSTAHATRRTSCPHVFFGFQF
jgi:hypothetical protein